MESYLPCRSRVRAWGSLFGPSIPISISTVVNHRDWPECAETFNERTLHMFKSQQSPSPRGG